MGYLILSQNSKNRNTYKDGQRPKTMPNGEIPYKACMPYQDTNSIVIPRFLANIREHPKFGDEYRPIDLMRYRDATVGWLNSKRISTKNQRRDGGNLDDLGFFVDKAHKQLLMWQID